MIGWFLRRRRERVQVWEREAEFMSCDPVVEARRLYEQDEIDLKELESRINLALSEPPPEGENP